MQWHAQCALFLYLSCHRFQKHSNGHSRRKCMWIDYKIWPHSSDCWKWHINVWPQLRANTLLAMSATKLITNNRISSAPETYISLSKEIKVKSAFLLRAKHKEQRNVASNALKAPSLCHFLQRWENETTQQKSISSYRITFHRRSNQANLLSSRKQYQGDGLNRAILWSSCEMITWDQWQKRNVVK